MDTPDSVPGNKRGGIALPARIHRVVMSLCLMALNIWGILEFNDWKGYVALVLQVELLLTGLSGWCPLHWFCYVRAPDTFSTPEGNPEASTD